MNRVENLGPDPDKETDPEDSQTENDIELIDSMRKDILILKIPAVMLLVLSLAIVFFLLRDIGEMKNGGGKNLYVFFTLFTAVVCMVKALSFMFYPRWKRLLSILPIRWWGLRILGITYMYFLFYLLITSDVDMAETFRVLMVLAIIV